MPSTKATCAGTGFRNEAKKNEQSIANTSFVFLGLETTAVVRSTCGVAFGYASDKKQQWMRTEGDWFEDDGARAAVDKRLEEG